MDASYEWERQQRDSVEFHLLCSFMVAWTGHVGHVGSYGLDLPHELISNPGIILELHSVIEPLNMMSKNFLLRPCSFLYIQSIFQNASGT